MCQGIYKVIPRLLTGRKDIFPRLVDCIKKDLDSCIAYMKDRFKRWKHIRTTNIIRHGFKEVKRRVKVMETFPTEQSCI
ncbi:MAG: hypothetical protein DRP08_06420 [Candidatus Aenigmatarchaeota archaeon]|nr:MAG: hypothetical protein DRP08_06420 [Candidatus Aenigmarchaeota archaeon]